MFLLFYSIFYAYNFVNSLVMNCARNSKFQKLSQLQPYSEMSSCQMQASGSLVQDVINSSSKINMCQNSVIGISSAPLPSTITLSGLYREITVMQETTNYRAPYLPLPSRTTPCDPPPRGLLTNCIVPSPVQRCGCVINIQYEAIPLCKLMRTKSLGGTIDSKMSFDEQIRRPYYWHSRFHWPTSLTNAPALVNCWRILSYSTQLLFESSRPQLAAL